MEDVKPTFPSWFNLSVSFVVLTNVDHLPATKLTHRRISHLSQLCTHKEHSLYAALCKVTIPNNYMTATTHSLYVLLHTWSSVRLPRVYMSPWQLTTNIVSYRIECWRCRLEASMSSSSYIIQYKFLITLTQTSKNTSLTFTLYHLQLLQH